MLLLHFAIGVIMDQIPVSWYRFSLTGDLVIYLFFLTGLTGKTYRWLRKDCSRIASRRNVFCNYLYRFKGKYRP